MSINEHGQEQQSTSTNACILLKTIIWTILALVSLSTTLGCWTIPNGQELYSGVWRMANCTIVYRPYAPMADFECPGVSHLIRYRSLDSRFDFDTSSWMKFYFNNKTGNMLWDGDFEDYYTVCEFYFILSLVLVYYLASMLTCVRISFYCTSRFTSNPLAYNQA